MQKIYAHQALTPSGWQRNIEITVGEDGRIARVEPGIEPGDATVDLVLPAPTNLHSHTFQRAMAGLTEGRAPEGQDSFWTWRTLMYRFLERLAPDHIEAIAAQAFMEMLEAGYGAVAEFHYLHHDVDGALFANPAETSARIVAAAGRAGIGLTHLPVLYTWGGCDQRPLAGGQLRFGNDPDQFARLFDEARSMIMNGPDDYRIGVAPHSLRAVDKSGLTAAIDLADGAPLHIHVAEQIAEVEEVEACFGARPVAWLLHEMPIDERWCLIHTTQMTAPETRELALSGAVAGLCPITEANLGDGIFNGARFLDAGGRFGIGTDSNVHIALFEELCALEYSQRLRDRGRAALALPGKSTGRTLFEAAASAGARAAGRDSGSLHEGCIADLLGISTNNAWLCDRTDDALLDSLIFSGRGRDCITDVWSAGRHVVRKGRHHNRATISGRFRRAMAELRKEV